MDFRAYHIQILRDSKNTLRMRGLFNVHLTQQKLAIALSESDPPASTLDVLQKDWAMKSNAVVSTCTHCKLDSKKSEIKTCSRVRTDSFWLIITISADIAILYPIYSVAGPNTVQKR